MKKLLFLGAISVLSLTACRSDNNDSTNPAAQLVGTWKISKYVEVSGSNGSTISTENATGCSGTNTYQFTSDNKFVFKNYSNINGGPCTLNSEDKGTYNYNASNKLLTITHSDNSTEVSEILSISNSQFVLVGETGDFNGDGVTDKTHVYFYK